ncbi:MAG: SAF domain-containing protein [Acidimicrobiales bacterium]
MGSAIGFSSAWLRASGRQEVLVVTRSLSTGQVLLPSDLQQAQLSVASGIASIPASEMSQVIGRPVSTTLTSGTLLTESDVAQTAGPPSGRAVVGLALKAGQYPPDVESGERVLVVIDDSASIGSDSSTNSDPTSPDAPMEATVIGVEAPPGDSPDSLVVTIQLAEGNGATVASAASAGNVALAVVSSGTSP